MAQTRDWALMLPAALRQVISTEARGEHADEILAAAGRSSEKLVGYLEPLIGVAGAHALHERSIKLSRRPPLGFLGGGSPAQESALESSVALLVTFVNLLASFIGERLTVQVLCQVWPDAAPLLRSKKESP